MKKIITVLALLLLIAAGYYFSKPQQIPEVTFTTIKGEKISIESLKGKLVLVNFWATDCTSCVNEMPELIQAYNHYKNRGFELIAVAMPYDPPAQVFNFATQKKLPFPVMHDGFAEMTEKFGNIAATPTAFLFDKNGKRLLKTTGTLDFEHLEALLNQHI